MIDRLKYIVNILIVSLLFGAIAITKDGQILGVPADEVLCQSSSTEEVTTPIEEVLMDGTRVINSAPLANDVVGFAGRTPVFVHIKDGVVIKVEAAEHSETPSFFEKLIRNGVFESWNGKGLEEASQTKVDIVSGATYSSRAVIENVNRAIAYGASVKPRSVGLFEGFGTKSIVGLCVILIGVFLTFTRIKNKFVEAIYMVLNIGVLGFWCGSFLSLSQVVAWMSNGINISVSAMLLAVVILMPIFGHKGSYCAMHCPMGSAQELLGRIKLPQIKLGHKLSKILNRLRYVILMALLLLMWIGAGFEIMDYEVFSAFLLGAASNVVLIMAAIFLVLSLFIKRPYCRFICPTGAMITIMQKTKVIN